ncbi:acid phosphatase-like protein [Westerdykella ornata]|uniref:Acid phosphatase-like protein n=1 Tax=Westerdykella ornata TaxID=318751 RepID=A0A6A6JE78_WESOR|nr:acid phosphatase-like protein [Westerdykella ornata]KAF2274587.1 acid phosphatase-like protein [Westerdykella ornata]
MVPISPQDQDAMMTLMPRVPHKGALVANTVLAAYTFNPLQHLAGISPYFEHEEPYLDPNPPQGCNVTRAAYLIRHSAIYANDFDYEEYIEPFTDKLKNTTVDWSKAGPLSFLSTWKIPIDDDDLEELTRVGELQSFMLGTVVRIRYPNLRRPRKMWTSTAERAVDSALFFMRGITDWNNSTELVQVPENKAAGANSLTPYKGCPKYSSSAGSKESSEYKALYTKPLIERFRNLAPQFNFTSDDIVGMQQLCGYETVIRGSSPFCSPDLFAPNDWLAFEYTEDVRYHYNVGYGNPISGVLGFPWVKATASTLLADEADEDIYLSFTHRELPPTVVVALGLFNNSMYSGADAPNATMPPSKQNHARAWRSSRIIPFLGNIAIEKMACDSYGYDVGDYFRVLVNRSPQQMPDCADGPGESCSKSKFEEFIRQRGELLGGYTDRCSPEYNNSTDVLSIYDNNA